MIPKLYPWGYTDFIDVKDFLALFFDLFDKLLFFFLLQMRPMINYYHTLYLKNGDYYNALVYLIQRIIYLTNSWLLEDYHVAFDEVYDLETFYLLFNFTKLNLDLDFENAYKNAFNEFKIPELRINYNRLHDISYRLLINGEDQYEISGDLLEESKKEGKFKSFSFF